MSSNSYPAVEVPDLTHDIPFDDNGVALPMQQARGSFEWTGVYGDDTGKRGGMIIVCPGCGGISALPFTGDGAKWIWNGDESKPTLTPSILHRKQDGGECWHGHLTDGVFVPC